MFKKVCVLLATILFVSYASVEAKAEVIEVPKKISTIVMYSDITYSHILTWPQKKLQMNVFAPQGKEKKPAVIFVPGGWWLTSPKNAGDQLTYRLAEAGYVTASIEYRLVGEADYKEIIGDVKSAVRYLRAHADEFNIDKNKIAVMGASAGGYLANMIGVTGDTNKFDVGENLDENSKVQAVIDFFGPTDLTKIAADYSKEKEKLYMSASSPASLLVNGVACYKNFKGGSILENPEGAKEANPLTYINKNTPPFLIMHGNIDQTISPSQSKILYDALQKNGIYSEYYVIKGYGHDFTFTFQPTTFNIILNFLNKVLKTPANH